MAPTHCEYLWSYTLPEYSNDDDDLERLLDQARARERQHDADGFNEVRAKVQIYVLKGNVPQFEGIVKWTEIRPPNLPRNPFNHPDAIDSIGNAHDGFVVGDRRGFKRGQGKGQRNR